MIRNLVQISVIAIVAYLLATCLSWPLEIVELESIDWRFQSTPRPEMRSDIVLIDIDDKSIEELGRWPWPRSQLAKAITALSEAGARAIVLDVLIAGDTTPKQDQALIDAIRVAGNVFVGFATELDSTGSQSRIDVLSTRPDYLLALSHFAFPVENDPAFAPPTMMRLVPQVTDVTRFAAGVGHVTVTPDLDGTSRETTLVVDWAGGVLPSLALAVSMDILDCDSIGLSESEQLIVLRQAGAASSPIEYSIPVDHQGRMLINFPGPVGEEAPSYSLQSVLRAFADGGADNLLSFQLAGKTCIITASFTGGTNFGATPLKNSTPLKDVLIGAINTIAENTPLHQPSWLEQEALVFLLLAISTVSILFLSPTRYMLYMGFLMAFYLTVVYAVFRFEATVFPVTKPILSIVLASGITTATSLGCEYRQRVRLRAALSRYMPEDIVGEIVRNPGFLHRGGERKEVSILAVGIVGFDRVASFADPEETVELLGTYYETISRIIHRHGGTVDRLVETQILAYFGHPLYSADHFQRAFMAAQEAVMASDSILESTRFATSDVSTRAGLDTGFATVGYFGDEPNIRHTVIGKRVKLACALEEVARTEEVLIPMDSSHILNGDVQLAPRSPIQFQGKMVSVLFWSPNSESVDPAMQSTVDYVPEEYRGAYRLIAKVGQGGMASVYRAYDENLKRFVAVKEPYGAGLHDAAFLRRFIEEARILARVNHPNIVQIYTSGDNNGVPYIAMEFVGGGALKELVEKSGPLDEERALTVIRDTAKGLHAAHREGIVHRDVKPGNLLVGKDGSVKVADFGLSKTVSEGEQLSATSKISGTPMYMSPEQARGEPLDNRTDIYALGMTLYFLLSGKPPFRASTPHELFRLHFQEPLPPLTQLGINVDSEIETLMLKMTAKDRKERLSSYTELISIIERKLATGESDEVG